jgi:hypothetical protein
MYSSGENLMEGAYSIYFLVSWMQVVNMYSKLVVLLLVCRYFMFVNVIDSSKRRVQRGGSSRSAAHSTHSTRDTI